MGDTKNILVVDDDKVALQITERILRKQGYHVDVAETGREAEEKVNSRLFDLALIDVRLPDIDGVDLVEEIHRIKPKMVKIVITGFASMENGIKAMEAGADAYLVKPVASQELLRIVEQKLKDRNDQ
ncbi:MAG TPA: response regulator [Candidatus Bathyarchaeia archaeon]|nr:response regulator [Candidatus Bathyarchaeia archaeon]